MRLQCLGLGLLKEMGILDRLTCLLRNLRAGQEATVRTVGGQGPHLTTSLPDA